MSPAQFNDRRSGLPLLQDGELLFGGNASAADLGGWIWVHLHKLIHAFQTVQISTGADQLAGQHTSLKQRIAGKFHISQADVVIVGSAKLGFSIAPEKRFREFGESSDIDVAIVSSDFYVKVWYELFNYERSGAYWEHAKEFEHYCFRGWIRPDKLPRSSVYPFSKSWWDFFQSLTASGEFGPYKIRAALYHSKHFIDAYQRLCVDQCKQELE